MKRTKIVATLGPASMDSKTLEGMLHAGVNVFRVNFSHGFANHAKVTLHIDALRGRNAHHIIETIYKAFGRALRMAVEPDPRMAGAMPSTKGSL